MAVTVRIHPARQSEWAGKVWSKADFVVQDADTSATKPVVDHHPEDTDKVLSSIECWPLHYVAEESEHRYAKFRARLETLRKVIPSQTCQVAARQSRKFTLFPELPAELRGMIWRASQEPFQVRGDLNYCRFADGKWHAALHIPRRRGYRHVTLYRVCRESRYLAFLSYGGVPGDSTEYMPFDSDRDSFVIGVFFCTIRPWTATPPWFGRDGQDAYSPEVRVFLSRIRTVIVQVGGFHNKGRGPGYESLDPVTMLIESGLLNLHHMRFEILDPPNRHGGDPLQQRFITSLSSIVDICRRGQVPRGLEKLRRLEIVELWSPAVWRALESL